MCAVPEVAMVGHCARNHTHQNTIDYIVATLTNLYDWTCKVQSTGGGGGDPSCNFIPY